MRRIFTKPYKWIKGHLIHLKKLLEDVPLKVIGFVLLVATVISIVEDHVIDDSLGADDFDDYTFFGKIGLAFRWAIVTLTTVGYGDYYPREPIGQVLAVVLMGFGIVFTSVLSGAIASIFVERKLREGRGMKEKGILFISFRKGALKWLIPSL